MFVHPGWDEGIRLVALESIIDDITGHCRVAGQKCTAISKTGAGDRFFTHGPF